MTQSKFFYTFFFISLILAGQCLAEFDPENCVGMWLFDDASGDIAIDSTENENDGIIMNDPQWVDGKIGSALELDGQGDWINMGDDPILKPPGDVTFVAWYYWIGGNYVLASGAQTASTGYAITHQPNDDTIWFGVNTSERSANTGYLPGTSREEWHHLAGSYSDDEGKLTAYIDGKPLETVDAAAKANINQWPELHIGKPNNVENYYMQGIIDEVAIFNVALTQADINAIMTRGLEEALSVSALYKLATKWGEIKAIP